MTHICIFVGIPYFSRAKLDIANPLVEEKHINPGNALYLYLSESILSRDSVVNLDCEFRIFFISSFQNRRGLRYLLLVRDRGAKAPPPTLGFVHAEISIKIDDVRTLSTTQSTSTGGTSGDSDPGEEPPGLPRLLLGLRRRGELSQHQEGLARPCRSSSSWTASTTRRSARPGEGSSGSSTTAASLALFRSYKSSTIYGGPCVEVKNHCITIVAYSEEG